MDRMRIVGARGFAIFPTLIFLFVSILIIGAIISLGVFEFRRQHYRSAWERCYQIAENALLEGVQRISEAEKKEDLSGLCRTYGKDDMPFEIPDDVDKLSMKITADSSEPSGGFYLVKASCGIRDRLRTIEASVQYRPSSNVFDYCYFLNNWGWFWGEKITAHGDVRSNFNFDFRYSPTMNGHIYASGNIQNNGKNIDPLAGTLPVDGWADGDPLHYGHQGTRRLKMPNLKDINDYCENANGTIRQVNKSNTALNRTLISKTSENGVYLKGTQSAPIEIEGTVVVKGDCVLSGVIGGTGTLYVGGNLYIADDVEYLNGPVFNTPPNSANTPDEIWDYYDHVVDSSLKGKEDLIAYGVVGQILVGDVNDQTWVNNCYSNSDYGLRYIGSENALGSDGIRGTSDDGIAYLDTDNDGEMDYAAYDADGNGVIRTTNYSYSDELKMTDARAKNIQYYPQTRPQGNQDAYADWFDQETNAPLAWSPGSFSVTSYSSFAQKDIAELEGIFFTNHAMAMHTNKSFTLHGSMICRDEAMVFNGNCNYWQDWRIHSRYIDKFFDGDGNRIIDLDLPVSTTAAVIVRNEINPEWPLK